MFAISYKWGDFCNFYLPNLRAGLPKMKQLRVGQALIALQSKIWLQ